jgi:NAD(P)H-hydrate epimerase
MTSLTVDQMREVDRLMVDEMGISLLQMMENAGRSLAEQGRRMLGGDVTGRRIKVLAGPGGNGGGGLAAARRLSIWGAEVVVVLGQTRNQIHGVPAQQLATLDRMAVETHGPEKIGGEDAGSAELVIDALIGYSLRGAPRDPIASLIRRTNASGTPVLALDVPSGLNADTGEPSDPTIRAAATLTLALPKGGLLGPAARAWTGDLYIADISVPPAVYRRLGVAVGPIFGRQDIVPLVEAETEGMPEDGVARISAVLREAAELHHRVYRIVDGKDANWASWYADWLIHLSELPNLLGTTPLRAELVSLLVGLDNEYAKGKPDVAWDQFYAEQLARQFSPSSARGSQAGH